MDRITSSVHCSIAFNFASQNLSGKRDLNPRPSPWQGNKIYSEPRVIKVYERRQRIIIQGLSFKVNSDRRIVKAMENDQSCTRRGGEVVAKK
jgi:hypothetical protein